MGQWIESHIPHVLWGIMVAILGYFSPITGVISVVIAAIFLDMVVGIIASRKKGQAIRSKKIWRTITKIFYSVMIISLLFALDTEMDIYPIHNIIAWFIAGVEIWSILESVAVITENKLFIWLRKFMEDKIEDVSGINIRENKK